MTEPIINTQLTTESQITSPEPLPQTPQLTPKKTPILPILVGAIIFILVSAVGYLGFQVDRLNKIVAVGNTPAPTEQPAPSPAPDPTANWKTYSSKEMGLSFQYPQTWTMKDSKNNEYKEFTTDTAAAKGVEWGNYLFIVEKENAEKFNSWIKDREAKVLSVNSIQGKTFERYITGDMYSSLIYVLKINNEDVIQFLIYPYETGIDPAEKNTELENQKELENTMIQILSTLKFNDTATSIPSTNWKTYTSPEVVEFFSPFSISYPSNWTLKEQKGADNPGSLQVELVDSEQNNIMIIQGPGGGGNCVYPGDPDYETQEAAKFYDKYAQLTKPTNWRISKNKGESSELKWELCQKTKTDYIDSTKIGWINISLTNQNALDTVRQILETVVYKPTAKTKTNFD